MREELEEEEVELEEEMAEDGTSPNEG